MACRADERLAGEIFSIARLLAHEHHLRMLIPSPNTVRVPVFHKSQALHSAAAACSFGKVGFAGTRGKAVLTGVLRGCMYKLLPASVPQLPSTVRAERLLRLRQLDRVYVRNPASFGIHLS